MRQIIGFVIAIWTIAGTVVAQDAMEGEALYMRHCAACHGADATGDGPMAPVLLVPPSNLSTLTERYGEFPLLRIVSRIDGRDPLVSHGSDMPVWGWFFEGEGAAIKTDSGQPVLTTRPIVDLVAYLESLQE